MPLNTGLYVLLVLVFGSNIFFNTHGERTLRGNAEGTQPQQLLHPGG